MRRPLTSILLAGLATICIAAVVDALIGEDERRQVLPTTTGEWPSLAADLASEGVSGLLYLGRSADEGCLLEVVGLPELETVASFGLPGCRFAASSFGEVATGYDCRRPGELRDLSGVVLEQFTGCAPAWKPNGQLTFVRGGGVLEVDRGCVASLDECTRASVSEADLQRALGYLPGTRSLSFREIAWLDDKTMAAIVRRHFVTEGFRGVNDLVAVFTGRRLAARPSFSNPELSHLRVNRDPLEIYARGAANQGYFVLRRDGEFDGVLPFSGVPEVSSIAPSPDGSWTAVAGRASVLLFRRDEPMGRALRLPFAAREVAWLSG